MLQDFAGFLRSWLWNKESLPICKLGKNPSATCQSLLQLSTEINVVQGAIKCPLNYANWVRKDAGTRVPLVTQGAVWGLFRSDYKFSFYDSDQFDARLDSKSETRTLLKKILATNSCVELCNSGSSFMQIGAKCADWVYCPCHWQSKVGKWRWLTGCVTWSLPDQ